MCDSSMRSSWSATWRVQPNTSTPPARDLRLDELAVEPPERARRQRVAQRVVARLAHADRDVGLAARERGEEVARERDRLLQVGGHHRHVVALRHGEPGADRAERAVVARQRDQLRREARLLGEQPAQDEERGVGRAVDDEDDLERRVELAGQLGRGARRACRASARSCRPGRRPSRAAASSARHATRARERRRRQTPRSTSQTRSISSSVSSGKHGSVSTCSHACSVTGRRTSG